MATMWLLDVDGVVNASRAGWGAPPRLAMAYADGQGYRLRWEPALFDRIRLIEARGCEVVWSTTWCPHVDQLTETFGHRLCPAFSERPSHLTWDEVKINAALRVLADGDRLVWTDDSVVGPARRAYPVFAEAEADGRALLIAPTPSRGLRPEHLDLIDAFIAAGHTCRACPADCQECQHDQAVCECYEHQDVQEENLPAPLAL